MRRRRGIAGDRGRCGADLAQSPRAPFRAEAGSTLAGRARPRAGGVCAAGARGRGRAGAGGRGTRGWSDILVTTERGVPLAISTADCLAISVYDPVARALGRGPRGLARDGERRGAGDGAGGLRRAGAPERLRVAIGPSIGPCCYEVDEPVMAEFARVFRGRWSGWMRRRPAGHWMLDLWAANEDLLARGRRGARGDRERAAVHGLSPGALVLVSAGRPRPARHDRRAPLSGFA